MKESIKVIVFLFFLVSLSPIIGMLISISVLFTVFTIPLYLLGIYLKLIPDSGRLLNP